MILLINNILIFNINFSGIIVDFISKPNFSSRYIVHLELVSITYDIGIETNLVVNPTKADIFKRLVCLKVHRNVLMKFGILYEFSIYFDIECNIVSVYDELITKLLKNGSANAVKYLNLCLFICFIIFLLLLMFFELIFFSIDIELLIILYVFSSLFSVVNLPIVFPSKTQSASFAIILVILPIEIPTKCPFNELPSTKFEHIIPLAVEQAIDIAIRFTLFETLFFDGFFNISIPSYITLVKHCPPSAMAVLE